MNTSRVRAATRRRAAGFTLIEALLAMAVMAFGMLALVSLQGTFRITSDDAKLRTEATRLAQQKIDELRAFEQVAADAGKFDYTNDVVSSASAESINPGAFSNATFSRSWTVTASATGMHKTVQVNVAWADRTGPQQVSLSTVIGRNDPQAISTLGVGPGTTVVRRPKNRNIDIPYPAVQLGDNKSAFQPPGSTLVIVFDNTTGEVLGKCNSATLPAENGSVNLSGAGCDSERGYLLSGYVRFCTSNGCGASNQPGDTQAKFANASDTTLPLDATSPLMLDSTNQSGGTPSMTCRSAREVTLKSTAQTVADTGQADNQVSARFVSYVCIVYPVDHDGDGASSAPTPRRWWGRTTLNPSSTWVIGTSSGQYKVCRFTGDYNVNGTVSNSEHPLWYRGVTGALDAQNYLVIPRGDSCPTDKATDPASGDFVSANTATHQRVGASSTDAVLSFTCSTIACSGPSQIEPTNVATDVKME